MNMITKKIKSNKGMTLIETVVAFAILAIIAVVIIMGFNTMGNILKEGSQMSRLDQDLQKQIAMGEETTIKSDAALVISGDAIKLNGSIKEYEITENGTTQTFRIFVAE